MTANEFPLLSVTRASLVAFFTGVAMTPLYLIRVGKPQGVFQWLHIAIATVAFVLWAYLLGGPFSMEQMNRYLWPYDKQVAGFAVGLFTWAVALIPYERLASGN